MKRPTNDRGTGSYVTTPDAATMIALLGPGFTQGCGVSKDLRADGQPGRVVVHIVVNNGEAECVCETKVVTTVDLETLREHIWQAVRNYEDGVIP